MRRKGVLILTVFVVAVAIFPPSAGAGACVWCNPDLWQDFQDCLYWEMRNEPAFGQLPLSNLDDFKTSVWAASKTITTKSSSSMKMKMIVGAMGGELAELLKLLSPEGGLNGVLMNKVRVCNVDVIGKPDTIFLEELSKTLKFMMDLPSYDNPESVPNDNNAFPQNSGQSLTNPLNFNGKNINSSPDFNNMRQSQSISSVGTIINNGATYRGNNPLVPSEIAVPNNQYAGSRLPTQTNANADSFSYQSQPQITARGFNTFNQNPSTNPSITNANAASNSYSIAQSANLNPGSRPYPVNPGYFNQPQITRTNAASSANSYNLANANTISNIDQNIPQNNVPNPFLPGDFSSISNQDPSNPTNSLQNQQIPSQLTNLNGRVQSASNIQRSSNQYNIRTSPYKEPLPNSDYWIQNQNYPAVDNLSAPQSSGLSAIGNLNENLPDNYPAVTNNTPKNGKKLQNGSSNLKKQLGNKINAVTNQKSLQPSLNDDDVARAMRFVETLFVILSQSSSFKSVFNEQIPNDQALSLIYKIDVGALNDCGYSQFSVEIANACTVLIESLPDGCSFVQYAKALSKAIMDQLNLKKLIGGNPEDQAKCIANNILTRLQKIYPVTATTTLQPPSDGTSDSLQPPLAANSDSTFLQGSGSQLQLTNGNSDGYSSHKNPNIRPQLINYNGAQIYRPNADQKLPQNNLQNKFLQGNDALVNNAVPYNLINKPQNQPDSGPGPMNQQPDSSATVTNKNVGGNPILQTTDRTYNGEGINNAATIFYQKLLSDLLSCPYISKIYNEGITKTTAKAVTETLLLGSLSTDYDKLAPEISRVCIERLSLVQAGSNTELYATVIARCITDGFFYYGLISQKAPLPQASDVSSKIIAWLTNNGNQLANKITDVQSNLPNQDAMNYPDSYSGVPNLLQGQQPVPSEILVPKSGGITDNQNADNLGPQNLGYNNQYFNSNSPPITYDGLQNIRASSNANSFSVSTNKNKGKNKNGNKNKQKSQKPKKKKTVSKTNFNLDNFNDYFVKNSAKNKPNSPPDMSNGDNLGDYSGNVNYQPNNVPNTQWLGSQNYPAQNVNPYYDLSSGAAQTQNDNIPSLQQGTLPSGINKSTGKKKCKKSKGGKGSNATNNPFTGDDLNTNNYPANFKGDDYPGPPSNGYDAGPPSNGYDAGPPSNGNDADPLNNSYETVPNQDIPPVSPQFQIIPDEKNDEVKDRIRNLTKGVLSSLTTGKFDYKLFSDIIADVSQILQATHPELDSQTCFIKTLIDSIVACTQLLKKVPSNYFDNIVLQNSDIPDAAAIAYSNSISQGDQGPKQTNQNNVPLYNQNNQPLTLPQQSNLNNPQTGNFYTDSLAPLSNINVLPTRQDSVKNVALNDKTYELPTLPQQNYLNNDQIRNVYPGSSVPLTNNNVPPPRQDIVNNVDQYYGPQTLPQQNNFNNAQTGNFYPAGSILQPNTNVQQNNLNKDQIGQGNFYPGSAPLLNTNISPTENGYGRQNLPLNSQNGLPF